VTTAETIIVNIEVRKPFQRAIQEGPATDHVAAMIKATSTSKWTLELVSGVDGSTDWYKQNGQLPTTYSIFFRLTGKNSSNVDLEKNDRLVALAEAAMGTKNQRRNWSIYAVDGEKWTPMTGAAKVELANLRQDGKSMVSYAEVSMPDQEMVDYAFEEIYGCGPQLRLVMSKIREAIQNEFKIRQHGLLIGKPGAAKSFTLQKLAMILPKDAVMWIDGTAMTSAGIIDALKDAETMPRFIFVEEIDKSDSAATAVLLGIMDKHGEIRKTTYRDKVEKECRCVVLATANSLERMQKIADGALLSRFGGNPITYERGQEEVLRKILHRELNDIDRAVCSKPIEKTDKAGKVTNSPCGSCKECKRRNKWIDETIQFCKDNKSILAADTLDPRFVIDLCIGLSGDKNGTYLEDVLATSIKSETITDFD
jgi:AAA domain (dynein-related subfamily)